MTYNHSAARGLRFAPPVRLSHVIQEEKMHYEKWITPFSDIEGLGRNFLLRTENLVIEVFEYKKVTHGVRLALVH